MQDFLDTDMLEKAVSIRALHMIKSVMTDYDASKAHTKVKDNDLFYTAKIAMTRAHLKYLSLHLFRSTYKNRSFVDPKIRGHLDLMTNIFCLADLTEDNCGAALFDTGFFAQGSIRLMQKALE